jgi:hypothetical protein
MVPIEVGLLTIGLEPYLVLGVLGEDVKACDV